MNRIDEARELLEQRLSEVEAEAEQLRSAIAELSRDNSGGSSRMASRAERSAGQRRRAETKARRGTRKRAPKGQREAELLESISTSPQLRISEHARVIGVSPQQTYPLLKRLENKGAIKRTEDGRYERVKRQGEKKAGTATPS